MNLKNLTLLKDFFYSFAGYAEEKVTYKLRFDYTRISWTRYEENHHFTPNPFLGNNGFTRVRDGQKRGTVPQGADGLL